MRLAKKKDSDVKFFLHLVHVPPHLIVAKEESKQKALALTLC